MLLVSKRSFLLGAATAALTNISATVLAGTGSKRNSIILYYTTEGEPVFDTRDLPIKNVPAFMDNYLGTFLATGCLPYNGGTQITSYTILAAFACAAECKTIYCGISELRVSDNPAAAYAIKVIEATLEDGRKNPDDITSLDGPDELPYLAQCDRFKNAPYRPRPKNQHAVEWSL